MKESEKIIKESLKSLDSISDLFCKQNAEVSKILKSLPEGDERKKFSVALETINDALRSRDVKGLVDLVPKIEGMLKR